MEIVEKTCLWDKLKTSSKPILLFGLGDGGDKIISASLLAASFAVTICTEKNIFMDLK